MPNNVRMSSVSGGNNPSPLDLQPDLQPWEKMDWSPEHEQAIYRQWAQYYTYQQELDIGALYYDKCLKLKEDDHKALYYRSMCKRKMAQTEEALQDALDAQAIDDNSSHINWELSNALYELNQFVNCKIELHRNVRKFHGQKITAFVDKIGVVDLNILDCIGESLTPFLLVNQKCFASVLEDMRREKQIEERPFWKILREGRKCDVLSVLDKQEITLSPREIARRDLSRRIFNQIYINKSWVDVLFLKQIRSNPNVILNHLQKKKPFLKSFIDSKYGVVRKFLKMLQARSPLYTEYFRRCTNKDVWAKHRSDHLYRVQHQTRRNMLTILSSIRELRSLGRVDKLSRYVEEVMGDYIVLKTHRLMPWKFEFVNEVYNTLGLSHADQYVVPDGLFKRPLKNRILINLCMPPQTKENVLTFEFGDRSSHHETLAVDHSFAYKKAVGRYEQRMRFAKYPIERCYLLHEIARSHLNHSHLDECCSAARKAIEEAKYCNSVLWQFLSSLLICKAHAVLHKVERTKEALTVSMAIAQQLKNPQLITFMETCLYINDEELAYKKHYMSMDSVRARKSRNSMTISLSSANVRTDENEVISEQSLNTKTEDEKIF